MPDKVEKLKRSPPYFQGGDWVVICKVDLAQSTFSTKTPQTLNLFKSIDLRTTMPTWALRVMHFF